MMRPPRHARLRACWFSAGFLVLIGAAATSVRALPNPDEPIDPTRRAPISTADAVRPTSTALRGDGVIGARVIRMSEIPVRRAVVGNRRAPIVVRAEPADRVLRPSAETITAREFASTRADEQRAPIPRLDPEQFRRLLREYENNRTPAAGMLAGEIEVGRQRVDLAEINRFANPRATLEAQGIPVIPAGSGVAPEAGSAPVPISQEEAAPAGTPERGSANE